MRKMFVGGLHPNLTTKSLIAYFSQFGKIEKGIIMTDKKTGKSRGFGFIVFRKKETIDVVMSYSNCHFLCGKWVECKRTKPKTQNIKMINENNKNPNINYYKNLNDESKKNNLFKNNNNNINNNNENSNIENNNNSNNIYENNVVVNNYFAKKGQALYGYKYLYDKNLFMYQNYIPRKKIKYFLNNNNPEEKENNLDNNNNLNNINNNILNETENQNKIYFQNYFHNIIINPSTYNYFHYKLFDIKGNELSKLKTYNNYSKILLFSDENNNNKNDLNNNVNNIINNVLNNNLKNNINNNINSNNDNNINILNNNNNTLKLSLFNNSNIENNLEKYQNKKQQKLFDETKTPKLITIKENKKEKNFINNNNNIIFNNNLINDNIKQINNNNFGPNRNFLRRKEKNKRLLGFNENYQPY